MSASTRETQLALYTSPNTMVGQSIGLFGPAGEVVEWFMALVLKTSVGASPPSVRIRPSPLLNTASPVIDWVFLLRHSTRTLRLLRNFGNDRQRISALDEIVPTDEARQDCQIPPGSDRST